MRRVLGWRGILATPLLAAYGLAMLIIVLVIGLLLTWTFIAWSLALAVRWLIGLDLGCRTEQGLWPFR